MSRDGFSIADIDSNLMADPKVVALARSLRDPQVVLAAVGVYLATLLASWRSGERTTADEALPAWVLDVEPFGPLIAALQSADLLDADGRPPQDAWEGWFGPAYARRAGYRKAAAAGGAATARRQRTDGAAPVQQQYANGAATLQSVRPSDRSDRVGTDGESVREPAPEGSGSGPARFTERVPRPPK